VGQCAPGIWTDQVGVAWGELRCGAPVHKSRGPPAAERRGRGRCPRPELGPCLDPPRAI